MITKERLIWLETNEREGSKIGSLPVILSKDFLELIALSRWALDAKEALEQISKGNDTPGVVNIHPVREGGGIVGKTTIELASDVLKSFPSEERT